MWIESHQALARHPKVDALAAALGVSKATTVGHLTYLWWFTAEFAPTGRLRAFSPDQIARACEWTGDATKFIEALVATKWLDRRAKNSHFVHHWNHHSGKWIRWSQRRNARKRSSRAHQMRRRAGSSIRTGTRTAQSRHRVGTRGAHATVPNQTVPNQTVPDTTGNDTHTSLAPASNGDAHTPMTPQALGALWNAVIPDPQVREITGKRLAAARGRLKEHPDSAWWQRVIERVRDTPFLRGAGERGWKADFDWLVRNDTNALRVLEGSYLDHGPRGPTVQDRMASHQAALDALPGRPESA